RAAFAEGLKRPEGGSYECRLRSVDGHWRHIHATFRAVTASDGRNLIYGLSQDISAQVRARETAEKYTERLKIALNAARAGVAVVDFKAEDIWCSGALVDILGQRLEWAEPGTPPLPMCHPEDRHLLTSVPWTAD